MEEIEWDVEPSTPLPKSYEKKNDGTKDVGDDGENEDLEEEDAGDRQRGSVFYLWGLYERGDEINIWVSLS
ncbi:hypothetical protein P8452_09002 [Trifolium repens]|nr:hypothetical protein P8452_09002 [Trifolium repens]